MFDHHQMLTFGKSVNWTWKPRTRPRYKSWSFGLIEDWTEEEATAAGADIDRDANIDSAVEEIPSIHINFTILSTKN